MSFMLINQHDEAEKNSQTFYRQHFQIIFFNENVWSLKQTLVKHVSYGPQIMDFSNNIIS